MGWTFTTRRHGMSVREFFEQQFNYSNEHSSGKVLDCSVVQRSVAYLAYERILADGTRYVVALVCLIKFMPNASDGYNFGYKDMDESMGPVEDFCPRRILEQLSPLDRVPGRHEHAANWRERCWARINKPKLKRGDVITLKHPLTFTNGHQSDSFTFIGRSTVRSNKDGELYRIRNLRRIDYAVTRP